jgi:hypothetical protein
MLYKSCCASTGLPALLSLKTRMPISLKPVSYSKLNARQKEAYNFQKVSAVLANYGYSTIRLLDDWQGADFIAQHCGGINFLKVQLKSRLMLNKKYQGKDLCVVFPDHCQWYIYKHDELLEQVSKLGLVTSSSSWKVRGAYSWPSLPPNIYATSAIKKL